MREPDEAFRETYARWLRVRTDVRALEASVDAAYHALRRDARRTGDRDVAALEDQLACQQRAIESLARDLEARIAEVESAGARIEAERIASIVTAVKTPRKRVLARQTCAASITDH